MKLLLRSSGKFIKVITYIVTYIVIGARKEYVVKGLQRLLRSLTSSVYDPMV